MDGLDLLAGQFEKIVVQVKSGHVNVQVLREFRDVVIQGQ